MPETPVEVSGSWFLFLFLRQHRKKVNNILSSVIFNRTSLWANYDHYSHKDIHVSFLMTVHNNKKLHNTYLLFNQSDPVQPAGVVRTGFIFTPD